MILGTKKQTGFTLIELLVIMAIIAFLISAVLLALSNSRQKSRNAKRVADIKQIVNGLNLFQSNCNSYPEEPTALVLDASQRLFLGTAANCGVTKDGSGGNGGIGPTASGTVIVQQFVPAPLPADGTCTDASGSNRYTYTSATGASYTLTFCVGAATGGYQAGVNTVSN